MRNAGILWGIFDGRGISLGALGIDRRAAKARTTVSLDELTVLIGGATSGETFARSGAQICATLRFAISGGMKNIFFFIFHNILEEGIIHDYLGNKRKATVPTAAPKIIVRMIVTTRPARESFSGLVMIVTGLVLSLTGVGSGFS